MDSLYWYLRLAAKSAPPMLHRDLIMANISRHTLQLLQSELNHRTKSWICMFIFNRLRHVCCSLTRVLARLHNVQLPNRNKIEKKMNIYNLDYTGLYLIFLVNYIEQCADFKIAHRPAIEHHKSFPSKPPPNNITYTYHFENRNKI